jgi:hypothetical protein
MIATQRTELVQALSDVAACFPEMRMGQLIVNLATLARGPQKESVWDVEDDELLEAAKKLRETFLQHIPSNH